MDIEAILEMYEDDYNPSSKVPGPRNMYNQGQLVQPNADGSRPGYNGQDKNLTEKQTKLKKFLKNKKTIKSSVLKDFILNKLGYGKYSAKTQTKSVAPNLKIEQDLDKNAVRMDKKTLRVADQYATLFNNNKKTDRFYSSSKKYAELPTKEKIQITNVMKANNNKFDPKYIEKFRFPADKEKILMETFNLTEEDFNKHGKHGVPTKINGKINPKYSKITRFVERDFKIVKGGRYDITDVLNADDIEFVKNSFDPPEGKEWNFKTAKNPTGNKYGISGVENKNLHASIRNKLKGSRKITLASDRASPQGWIMHAMERVYNNEIRNEVKHKDLTYKPIKKNGVIIGFTDTTTAGGNNTYYGLKKNMKEDGAAWTAHGDHERVKKFLSIAKGAQVDDPSKLLQKILDDKGITKLMGDKSVLTLNDILSHERYFDKISEIKPKKLIERQIVLHHTGGVGSGNNLARAAATKDLQLLTGTVNSKIEGFEKAVQGIGKKSGRKLTLDEISQLKNFGAKITDFDGKVVGGGYTDPTKQFAAIEKEALKYAKGDQFNVKTVASYLERLGCGKAAGGRILFAEGVPSLTKCAKKGVTKLENGLKSGFKNADDAVLARGILKSGKFFKDAVSLRGLFGPAALGFTALAEAGFVSYDMLSSGKSFREAIGDSLFNYVVKGTDYEIDSNEEFIKRLKSTGNMNDQQIGQMLNFKSVIDDMNRGFDLNTKLQDLEGITEIIKPDELGADRFADIAPKKQIIKTGKILDNQTNQAIGDNYFPDEAFQLDAERDALRADIQDYNRTGTPRRVTNYLLSDKAKKGADASALANLYVEQDQLQDAGIGNIYQSQKGDEKRVQRSKEIGYEIEDILNPTKYNDFARYFMSRPQSQQSSIMSLGYKEGGIASLNVNKK